MLPTLTCAFHKECLSRFDPTFNSNYDHVKLALRKFKESKNRRKFLERLN